MHRLPVYLAIHFFFIAGLCVADQQNGLCDVAALLRSMSLFGADNKQEHEMSLQINSRYICRLFCLLLKEKC